MWIGCKIKLYNDIRVLVKEDRAWKARKMIKDNEFLMAHKV